MRKPNPSSLNNQCPKPLWRSWNDGCFILDPEFMICKTYPSTKTSYQTSMICIFVCRYVFKYIYIYIYGIIYYIDINNHTETMLVVFHPPHLTSTNRLKKPHPLTCGPTEPKESTSYFCAKRKHRSWWSVVKWLVVEPTPSNWKSSQNFRVKLKKNNNMNHKPPPSWSMVSENVWDLIVVFGSFFDRKSNLI